MMGQPVYIKWERKAAEEFLHVARHVEAEEVILTVAAMLYLERDDPLRFESHTAFLVQVARRVRNLTDTNAGTTYDHERRKVRRVYRDLTPRAAVALGRWIIDTIGLACLKLVELEVEGKERVAAAKDAEKRAYKEAVAGLQ